MAKKKGGLVGRGTFVVASQVKSYVRGQDLMASAELADALSRKAQELLDLAVDRCLKNGRKTVRPHDL